MRGRGDEEEGFMCGELGREGRGRGVEAGTEGREGVRKGTR